MARYSGIYLHFEGTTSECDTVQQNRESVFDTASGMMRYQDSAGTRYYLGGGDGYWELESQGIYYPSLPDEQKIVRIGPTGNSSGVLIGFRNEVFDGDPSGLYLISTSGGIDMLGGRDVWLCGSQGMALETTTGGITLTSAAAGSFSTGGNLSLYADSTADFDANSFDIDANSNFDLQCQDGSAPTNSTLIQIYSASTGTTCELILKSNKTIDIFAGTNITMSGDVYVKGDVTLNQITTDDMPVLFFSGIGYVGRIEWRGQAGYIGGSDYFYINKTSYFEKSSTLDNALETGTDGHIYSRGKVIAIGDIYTSEWAEFSSTIRGWFPNYTATMHYKAVGKLVFINYSVTGSGNGDYTGFSLPIPASGTYATVPVAGYNNSSVHYSANTSGIVCFIDDAASNSWAYFPINGFDGGAEVYTIWGSGVAGDVKWICGQFWYQRT